ncbi:MAG: RecX family transcriptional regulator [Anaerolineales bacterium]|jgi:regulatory protein
MEGKITAIKVQQRNRERVSVYLDGEYAFGLSRIIAAWLKVGQHLDEARIVELKNEDTHEIAYQQALKYLNYRERSEAEVRQNLKGHDLPEESIEATMERLRRNKLVDDKRFADNWIDNRNQFRPRGRRALTYELKDKGISDEIIEQTLAGFDESEMAYLAASKKARRWEKLEWRDFRSKIYGFLARRGFNYETIIPVVERVWSETHANQITETNEMK